MSVQMSVQLRAFFRRFGAGAWWIPAPQGCGAATLRWYDRTVNQRVGGGLRPPAARVPPREYIRRRHWRRFLLWSDANGASSQWYRL